MNNHGLEIDKKLISKYGERSFMYTEYPNLRFWSKKYGDQEFRATLKDFLKHNKDASFLFYIHIPHCHRQCLFCTCEVIITLKYEDIKRYLKYLYMEINLFREFFEEIGFFPNFREVHYGGGSPTYLHEEDFSELTEKVRSIVDFSKIEECAIEIDPRHVKPEGMRYYAKQGVNRISFGVQDFDPAVQKVIDRVQPAYLTERLMTPELRALFSKGVNFDIICGLPLQTVETIKKTAEKIVKMSPDRICFNYLHMRPELFSHQLSMPAPPDNYNRKLLFRVAREILEKNGYIRTGYDHFARSTDDIARAMGEKKMQWNRLGVTSGRSNHILGLGIHGMSKFEPRWYFQNFYASREPDRNYKQYEEAVTKGIFPVNHGHFMSDDDLIRREVIHNLRNYFYVDGDEVEKKYSIDFRNYFSSELWMLAEFIEDGIVEISGNIITITELGYEFADFVCSRFDVYIRP